MRYAVPPYACYVMAPPRQPVQDGRKRLAKHEAQNRHAVVKSPLGTVYEITPNRIGPILFDFIAALT